jgi:hypothetical protein
MTTRTAGLKDELLACERAYLDAVQRSDGEAAARLTAPESLVVGGHGVMKVDGPTIRKMVEEHDSDRRYEIDESSVQVVDVTGDVAVVAYKLTTIMPGGETSEAFDTDVWVRRGDAWACALHVEAPASSR